MTAGIAVCGVDALPGALAAWRPDVVLMLNPSGHVAQAVAHPAVAHLHFDDIEQARGHVSKGGRAYPRVGATFDDVKAIIRLGRLRHARLLAVCTAGLSRSPAAAIIVLAARGVPPAEACARVCRHHPAASPNRWMLELADWALSPSLSLKNLATSTFRIDRDQAGARGERAGLIIIPA